jgi:predicted metal-dependent hydrolase
MTKQYQLKRLSRSRSLRVRVDPTGAVVVTAPQYVPQLMIDRFIEKSLPWIARQQQKIKLRQDTFPVLDWDKKVVSYLGKLYSIELSNEGKRIEVGRSSIYVNPVTHHENDVKKTLVAWLKREGDRVISQRTLYWSEKMGVRFKQLKFRQQRSRWGSCSSSGTITFNWRLIHFPLFVIDYVVIHELAHVKHHDHSDRFWSFVAQFIPAYKQHVDFLKKQVLELI